jgi:hypothetical protein
MTKKKKKEKKQKPVTTEFSYTLKRNSEYTDEQKMQFSIALLPVMERVITGHVAGLSPVKAGFFIFSMSNFTVMDMEMVHHIPSNQTPTTLPNP